MLRSPIKLGARPSAKDYQLSSGVTQVQGVPSVDHVVSRHTLTGDVGHVDTATDEITFDTPHGFVGREPVGWDESAGTQPAPFTAAYKTYYVIVVDATTIQLSEVPGGTEVDITNTGSGALTLTEYLRANHVLLTNYGTVMIGIRPCIGPSYSMTTNDEFVLHPDAQQPVILNVCGFDSIAAESIGGAGDLRVNPLENW